MSIGAIGGLGSLGAVSGVGYQPYVYNANTVSGASMNKLAKISDDVLDKKTDYSELVSDESKNINPLKKGETLDFQGMLEMQMQRGQVNKMRMMKPAEETEEAEEESRETFGVVVPFASAAPVDEAEEASVQNTQQDEAENMPQNTAGGNGFSSFQMQQAISAYEMFMTA